ncbi:hypothetical protein M501DRAFT_940658, partial [Patellaria atrata CBS 101060]
DIKKSEFHVIKTKFLSFIINTDGIAINLEKTKIILLFNKFYNFYRKFLEKFG